MKFSYPLKALARGAAVAGGLALFSSQVCAASSVLVGWSEHGLWETDGTDVSVFCMTPPYSTIHAQFMRDGTLVTSSNGITITFEAVADSNGSINSTSVGKGNFQQNAEALFGVALGPDEGLDGFGMPGLSNTPQAMTFDPANDEFTARGIPLTPYDDQGNKNFYPLMKLVARDSSGTVLASTQIVVPVSDEIDCRVCHGSGAQEEARPPEGWMWDPDRDRDYKLNILRSHDDHWLGNSALMGALATAGYSSKGLLATVQEDGKPITCLACHTSNALPGSGMPDRKTLTQVMHTKHAYSKDPKTGTPLTMLNNSASCLTCHAGPDTRRLRGVHHNLANPDGSPTLQCTSCHGTMSQLGAPGRQGWLDEPTCQSCHTGTMTSNNGELRYTNVIDSVTGTTRIAFDDTFATQSNVPQSGFALFSASHGHGNLQCAACHGSAHAELGSSVTNDNVQSQLVQGHTGRLADCTACHVSGTTNWRVRDGGPHGLHPVDSSWARNHSGGSSNCRACHDTSYQGGVISAMLGSRSYSNRNLWQGNRVGCYNCHNGPSSDEGSGVSPSTVSNRSATTTQETPVDITLQGSSSGLLFRSVSPPAHGTVYVNGNTATYLPEGGYVGNDSFTYAGNNGSVDSNLATVSVTVAPGTCTLTAAALVPYAAKPATPVPFRASAELSQCSGPVDYQWDFGDGSASLSGANVSHQYALPGDYTWSLTASANGSESTVTGVVTISPTLGPVIDATLTPLDPWTLQISWPADGIPTSVESASDLSQPYPWTPNIYQPQLDPTGKFWTLPLDIFDGDMFWRIRRVP